jgi:Holliday junction resolvase RusA-like endonuclease
MKPVTLTVELDPSPRKSTSREIVTRGKGAKAKPFLIKSKKARKFCDDFERIVGHHDPPLVDGYFMLITNIFYPTKRPDLSSELIQDCLESCGVISNDRQMVATFNFKHIDRENPRAVISVIPCDWAYDKA